MGLLYKCVRLAWVSCLFVVILFAFFKGVGVCLTYVFQIILIFIFLTKFYRKLRTIT